MMTSRATVALVLALVLALFLPGCTMAGAGPRDADPAPVDDEEVTGSAALEEAGLSGGSEESDESGESGERDGDPGRADALVVFGPKLETETPAPPPGEFLYADGVLPGPARRQVEEFVHALTEGRASERYRSWLEREAVWGDWVRGELRTAGLPDELVYLAMIESGFHPTIVSHAGATGMWQFMPATARAAGLRVDSWVDERRDPEAATRAAIRHLAELYAETGDWALSAAAYNAGLGRVRRAQAREPEDRRDYFSLSAARRLPRETRNYVPILLAAAWVDRHRDRYGLPPRVASTPPATDTLAVGGRTRLSVLAEALGVPHDTLKTLNSHLVRGAVPPEGVGVRVPAGTDTAGLAAFLAAVPRDRRLLPDWHETRYVVRPGDSYWRIARRHDTTVDRLRRLNPRHGEIIHPGDRLVVRRVPSYDVPGQVAQVEPSAAGPPAGTSGTATTAAATSSGSSASSAATETSGSSGSSDGVAGAPDGEYVVRAGDTMTGLAQRLGIGVDDLSRWNDMPSPRPLRIGETLKVAPPVIRYTVRPGDTMTGLARRYGVTLSQLAEWNGMAGPRPLRVGETLVVRVR